MKERTAKIITFLICPFLAYGFGTALYRMMAAAHYSKGDLIFTTAGFVSFIFIWRMFKHQLQVVCTFEHELTHLLFGLLFFKRPHSFVVTRHGGGYVELSGGNFLITLAPYFFPTVSYCLLPFAFFVPPKFQPVFLAIMGASIAFHMISTWGELHWRQTDLREAGFMLSLIFLPLANLIFYGALAAAVLNGGKDFFEFWMVGVRVSCNFLLNLLT